MRVLHYVGPGEDADHLIVESSDGHEKFSLHLDVPLRDATRTEIRRTPTHSHNATLTPREIQTRVRGGESPDAIAEGHGASLDWVMRFAANVLDERARVALVARESRAPRSDNEGKTVPFGAFVDGRFAAQQVDSTAVAWDSRRRDDGQWLVSATWTEADEHHAEWLFHLNHKAVSPIDELAANLLSEWPLHPAPVVVEGTRPTLTLAPDPDSGVVAAFPAMPDAITGPLPQVAEPVDEVFDQEAVEEPVRRQPARPADPELPLSLPDFITEPAPEPVRPAAAREPLTPVVTKVPAPSKPATVPGGAGQQRTTNKRNNRRRQNHPATTTPRAPVGAAAGSPAEASTDAASRAGMPSWDDILLGVRRKQD
jgi:hypothetical protein